MNDKKENEFVASDGVRNSKVASGLMWKVVIGLLVVGVITLIKLKAGSSWTTPSARSNHGLFFAPVNGQVNIIQSGQWSSPLPHLPLSQRCTWKVEDGEAAVLYLRDADHPEKPAIAYYWDEDDVNKTKEHISRHQWMAVGIKGWRPITISYRYH